MYKKHSNRSFMNSNPIGRYKIHPWSECYWNGKEYVSRIDQQEKEIEKEAQAYENIIKSKRKQNAA